MRQCGNHKIELGHQMFVMKRLEKVAEKVVQGESKAQRLEILRQQLSDVIYFYLINFIFIYILINKFQFE